MLVKFVAALLRLILKLRYRVTVSGLDEILKKGRTGILFLPNHPALIDPPIMTSTLMGRLKLHILVAEDQIQTTVLKHAVDKFHLLSIPDISMAGRNGADAVRQQMANCRKVLEEGGNLLMYPAGRVYRSRFENLRGKFGAQYLINSVPDLRIVMVRTTGLWGSSFSRSRGYGIPFGDVLNSNFKHLLRALIFFLPRRPVKLTFFEADDAFPRSGSKEEINSSLENFYNADAPFNTYVPYSIFEKGGIRTLPEPVENRVAAENVAVPAEIQEKVLTKLGELASVTEVKAEDKLGSDLGMDSLMICEVQSFLQQEFNVAVSNPDSLRSVSDVLQAAAGRLVAEDEPLKPVPQEWFIPADETAMTVPENCGKITDVFLKNAKMRPDYPLLADQLSGVLTNRRIILSIMALRQTLAALPGDKIGMIMPACAPFFVVFMASLFAGKTPVLLNWTVGPRNLLSCVKRSGIQCIVTSQTIIAALSGRGTDFSAVSGSFVYLEDLGKKITVWRKICALMASYLSWRSLRKAMVPETCAILFTSGSESEPKAVPLSHENCIFNLRFAVKRAKLLRSNRILAMLPPFHSFGLLIGIVWPAAANVQTVYHSNPTESSKLARLIAAYRATMIVGTPTFAAGILKNAVPEMLSSINLIVTGAEKCPQSVLELCHALCPEAEFLEGYGITECGPIVALNPRGAARKNSIGRVLDCDEWMICDDEMHLLPPGETGMLYVHGPCIFKGYLSYDGASPFAEHDGALWYRTGDLVQADTDGFLYFMGRRKRFVKVAGEMVSLPAVEECLAARFGGGVLAVEAAGPDEDIQLVLFTTIDLDKNTVNQVLREGGFSAICYIKQLIKLEEIPLLGTGKTDYRKLKSLL